MVGPHPAFCLHGPGVEPQHLLFQIPEMTSGSKGRFQALGQDMGHLSRLPVLEAGKSFPPLWFLRALTLYFVNALGADVWLLLR